MCLRTPKHSVPLQRTHSIHTQDCTTLFVWQYRTLYSRICHRRRNFGAWICHISKTHTFSVLCPSPLPLSQTPYKTLYIVVWSSRRCLGSHVQRLRFKRNLVRDAFVTGAATPAYNEGDGWGGADADAMVDDAPNSSASPALSDANGGGVASPNYDPPGVGAEHEEVDEDGEFNAPGQASPNFADEDTDFNPPGDVERSEFIDANGIFMRRSQHVLSRVGNFLQWHACRMCCVCLSPSPSPIPSLSLSWEPFFFFCKRIHVETVLFL